MLDSALLRSYINTFIGYGDFAARHWLVGMEEGGGGSIEAIERRFANWERQGRGELSDLSPKHSSDDVVHLSKNAAKLQPTWRQLIRMVLAIEDKPTDNKSVRLYQQTQLGRYDGDTCLLELMPLPSPDAQRWLYREHTTLDELTSRDSYMKHYVNMRTLLLYEKVRCHKPAAVIFYSFSYLGWWRQIAGVELTPRLLGSVKAYFGCNEHTVFAVVPQPAARMKGKGNAYYSHVGRTVAELLRVQLSVQE